MMRQVICRNCKREIRPQEHFYVVGRIIVCMECYRKAVRRHRITHCGENNTLLDEYDRYYSIVHTI